MSRISDIFDSQALSIQDTFLLHNSNVGYKVPIYQRGYRWGEKDIFRLFESVFNGITLLDEDSSIRFIGTIILSNDKEKKEKDFGGMSLSIVDGQQRLSTIALIICRLMNQIMTYLKKVDEMDSNDPLLLLLDSLRSCIVGRKNSTIVRNYLSEFYPRIIRESNDHRGHTASSKQYGSFIAEYLFDFGNHYYNFISTDSNYLDFEFIPSNIEHNIEDKLFFEDAIKCIDGFILRIANGDGLNEDMDDEAFPSKIKFLSNVNYAKVFENCGIQINSSSFAELDEKSVRVAFFACYLLSNVSLTCVQVEDDKYVFDIFDALNTTGEPLTAIETFKPEVIKFIEDQKESTGGFNKAKSKAYFDEMDKCISAHKDQIKRQKETKEIITSFALYINGDTQNYDLGGQRRYLRSKYSSINSVDDVILKKERFVKALRNVAIYRSVFWEEDFLSNSLTEITDFKERQVTLMCLDFIRDMNTTLAIPILARYYFFAEENKNWSDFISVVKSVTAFIAIRRAATGTTAGIDSDFRALMKKGHKKSGTKPIKLGIHDDNELVSPQDLNKHLLSYIDSQRLGTDQNKKLTKKSWTNKVIKQPLYEKSKALCKFLLMIAAHNTVEGTDKKHILLKCGRENCNFLELNKWRDSLYKTVEHIAPQNGRDSWESELYNEVDTIHTIGNLILLPKLENIIIGNKPWNEKRIFFRAFSEENKQEIPNIIEEAKNNGKNFSKAATKAIEEGKYMPLIYSITDVEKWNLDLVLERGENICHLAWHELSQWIGIENLSDDEDLN
ncbi:MAG: hypothetical protein BWK73_22085 [Thiothrix lacustris]|uniref:DUF262 domain-containing protein n=1 Tax=Thiothrix lacustris TaxID=525917 RepID=A0A1Y1QN23_9GAMM|nr:MAG: hypothetical protein BWK73_22085 [Thiothrix lacustris]